MVLATSGVVAVQQSAAPARDASRSGSQLADLTAKLEQAGASLAQLQAAGLLGKLFKKGS